MQQENQQQQNQEQQPNNKNKYPLSTIVLASFATATILVLAFLFYYFFTKSVSVPNIPESESSVKTKNVKKEPPVVKVIPTTVIDFLTPQTLPTVQKTGKCFASSVAQPFRLDAFRCMVENSIYDPCFALTRKGFVYCQTGIDASTGFLIKLTQALPAATLPAKIQTNWAWFLKLEDGTECSPFTGTRPFFGKDQVAYYGCTSSNPAEQIVLLGDLTQAYVWTANEAVLVKIGANWTVKSTKIVKINTVWK